MIEYPSAPGMPRSHLRFSPVARVGAMLFVAGQAFVAATGKIVPDTLEGELRRSIENLRRVVESRGSDLAHVVQTRGHVSDTADVGEFSRVYADCLRPPYPARTPITGCLPPTLRYVVECIAVVREDGSARGGAA